MNWFIEVGYRNGLSERIKFHTRDEGRDLRKKYGRVRHTGSDYDVVAISQPKRLK